MKKILFITVIIVAVILFTPVPTYSSPGGLTLGKSLFTRLFSSDSSTASPTMTGNETPKKKGILSNIFPKSDGYVKSTSGTSEFKDAKTGVEFKYSNDLVFDQKLYPHFYTGDQANRWIIVLNTKDAKDKIEIINAGAPAPMDCRKKLDQKTFTTNVTINYYKETSEDSAACKDSEKFIGWFATATKGDKKWYVSMATINTDSANQQRLEAMFMELIKSFKTL